MLTQGATCGTGIQRRNISCVTKPGGTVVPDSLCQVDIEISYSFARQTQRLFIHLPDRHRDQLFICQVDIEISYLFARQTQRLVIHLPGRHRDQLFIYQIDIEIIYFLQVSMVDQLFCVPFIHLKYLIPNFYQEKIGIDPSSGLIIGQLEDLSTVTSCYIRQHFNHFKH